MCLLAVRKTKIRGNSQTQKFREFKRREYDASGGDAIVAQKIIRVPEKFRVASRGRQNPASEISENRPARLENKLLPRKHDTEVVKQWRVEPAAAAIFSERERERERGRERDNKFARASTWK